MYPHYTVPIILPGLYNYYPHVPSLYSPYHFILFYNYYPHVPSLYSPYHFTWSV